MPFRSSMVVQALTQPYRLTMPMVVMLLLVPCYIFIPELMVGRTLHAPAIALDRVWPLRPAWALVYGSLWVFLILLPIFVVRHEEQLRRTVQAYLMVWIAAYVCFLVYPTTAPRPAQVIGEGFVAWGLRFLYSSDPPYNCFPSLHVAHSFVSALTCYRVHRGVGIAGMLCVALIGVSTLYTRQHYILDVIAGIVLAGVACALFLRDDPSDGISDFDRRVAPALALLTAGIVILGIAFMWVVYRLSGEA